ncbi:MAG: dUTP pyrophosphatase [Clostridia bacterium]|nr:dUTP pyrophosphatase [Clostridia bacterium]
MKINVSDKEIYFAKIRESAKIPTKKDEDAGYDVYADFEDDFFVIKPGESRPVPTGIATAFSNKYYAQIEERSSMAKNGIKKSGGVFDSGYRGEYFIVTYNTNSKPFIISKTPIEELDETFEVNGEKFSKNNVIIYPYTKAICQIVMHILPTLESKEISYNELCNIESERGKGGFGSSKK